MLFESGAICSVNSKKCLIGYGKQTWSEVPLQYPVWYAPDFFLKNKKPYLQFTFTEEITTEDLLKRLKKKTPISHCFDPLEWKHFDHFFEKFQQSGLKKVVPYVVKHANGSINIQEMLYHCLSYQLKNPRTAVYGFWNQEEGMLGATPELIISLDQTGTLKSDACAGTMPIALAEMMLTDQKLNDEHNCVIDGLRNALSPFGEVLIGKTEVARFSKIAHLLTPIEMKGIQANSINDIISKIYPSPAIGAFPKDDGLPFLHELEERIPRGRFGAPFGVLKSKEEALIYLAIRNIQWEKEKMKLMAGCGIVPESSLEEEKSEIEHKFAAIHEILGIHESKLKHPCH